MDTSDDTKFVERDSYLNDGDSVIYGAAAGGAPGAPREDEEYCESKRPYFILKIHVLKPSVDDSNYTEDLYKNYRLLKDKYINSSANHNINMSAVMNGAVQTFDAGFDLFVPEHIVAVGHDKVKINYNIRCSMVRVDPDGSKHYCGYYKYPRSSTGSKTPLRLSCSVGIIDSGYRGNIMSFFDNISTSDYSIDQFSRVSQITPPDMSYPMMVLICDSEDDLGAKTKRGVGGFGSSGI